MAREAPLVVVTLLLVPWSLTATAETPTPGIHPYSVDMGTYVADGLLAVPDSAPDTLVVFVHGYSHGVTEDGWLGHLEVARSKGYLALAMDFSATKFVVTEGSEETVAATHQVLAEFPAIDTVAVFSVSMGGAVAGTAIAGSPGTFDHWIDVEGVSRLDETWAEAAAVGHPARGDIEEETGGTPLTVPDAYVHRSPALRPVDLARSGLDTAIVVHPLNDGLVPYDQGRQMAAALRAVGVPTDFYTVLRGPCGEQGTTGTNALFGRAGPPETTNPLCLAGHATETSHTHPVMTTALTAMYELLSGERVPGGYSETVVDEPDP